jgi:hypothetical protein
MSTGGSNQSGGIPSTDDAASGGAPVDGSAGAGGSGATGPCDIFATGNTSVPYPYVTGVLIGRSGGTYALMAGNS